VIEGLAKRWWALEQKSRVNKLRNLGLTVVEWDGKKPLEGCLEGSLGGPARRLAGGRPAIAMKETRL